MHHSVCTEQMENILQSALKNLEKVNEHALSSLTLVEAVQVDSVSVTFSSLDETWINFSISSGRSITSPLVCSAGREQKQRAVSAVPQP